MSLALRQFPFGALLRLARLGGEGRVAYVRSWNEILVVSNGRGQWYLPSIRNHYDSGPSLLQWKTRPQNVTDAFVVYPAGVPLPIKDEACPHAGDKIHAFFAYPEIIRPAPGARPVPVMVVETPADLPTPTSTWGEASWKSLSDCWYELHLEREKIEGVKFDGLAPSLLMTLRLFVTQKYTSPGIRAN